MSETEQREKEVEYVSGVIEGITQKKADTWQVAVKPEGSQYAKNLWTKSAELVTALQPKIGQSGGFVCNVSYWTNQSGTEVRSLWIAEEADERPDTVPAASGSPRTAAKGPEGLSKEEWARKDSAADLRACIAIASGALQHTLPSDPSADDLATYINRVGTLSASFHRQVQFERTGEEVPF